MAKLYAKITSDIRGGLGCRGRDLMSININYNFDGKNEPAGALSIDAKHKKDHVEMIVKAIRVVGGANVVTPIAKVKFKKGGLDIK